FSRRRRHTRSKRDWSSDVCSSDLLWLNGWAFLCITATKGLSPPHAQVPATQPFIRMAPSLPAMGARSFWAYKMNANGKPFAKRRSEERRVGKEGRDGSRTQQQKEC